MQIPNNDFMNSKITIVTVCYNAVREIEKTILSVINQTYSNKEYIIIDGNSTDGTIDVVNNYSDRIDIIVTETDRGIYDAMNKGGNMASGEWIIFMNAGDCFANAFVLQNVCNLIENNTECEIFYGNSIQLFSKTSRVKKPYDIFFLKKSMPFSHQCVFVKKNLFIEHNFSMKYRLAADYEFFLYHFLNGKSFKYIPIEISRINLSDGATANNFRTSQDEAYAIRKEYGCQLIPNEIYRAMCIFRFYVSELLNR